MFTTMKRIFFPLIIIATMLLIAVPVAADTPPVEKPPASRTPTASFKGIVTEKGEAFFTIKTEQKVLKIGVDKDTRFFKETVQEKPPATTKAPVTTTRTPEKETPKTTTRSPEATATVTRKPESTTARAETPAKTSAPREPTLQVTFKDLAVGDTVAVETNGNTEQLLAKTVRVAGFRASEPQPVPTKGSSKGIVTTVNEERMAFSIKTASGEEKGFKYDRETSFSFMGSPSLKAGMEVEVAYIVLSGTPTARVVKMAIAQPPAAGVKK